MKTFIILILTITALTVNAQSFTIKKNEVDPFNKTSQVMTSWERIAKNLTMAAFRVDDGETAVAYAIYFRFTTYSSACLSYDSKMTLLLGNGETVEKDYAGDIECGTSHIAYYVLSEEEIRSINETTIKGIRIKAEYNRDWLELNSDNPIKSAFETIESVL